ncbi:MAG: tRNA pseudouridine(13) synthase TruD [Methanomicrobiales archaeon]|nr:tRNA pseudouridine(13) synthase TruD [Methanomicrobiales archaeon]
MEPGILPLGTGPGRWQESPWPLERELGMRWYGTAVPGIGGHLRETPEDFVVEEVSPVPGTDGDYLIARLVKRNWEQQHLVRELARRLGISHRRIAWAGTKDRRAVTTQLISLYRVTEDQIRKVSLRDVTLEPVGRSREGLALGQLMGNRFGITIRGCDPGDLRERVERISAAVATGIPNYYGIQRFGVIRPITHAVGEAILREEWEEAVMIYVSRSFPQEPEGIRAARQAFSEGRDVRQALREFPVHLTYERAMLHYLQENPGDYRGALRVLPPRLLSLFVSAFQSWLFNEILSRRVESGEPASEPVPGDLILFPDGKADVVTPASRTAARLQVSRGRAQTALFIPGNDFRAYPGYDMTLRGDLMGQRGISAESFRKASAFVGAAYAGTVRRMLLSPAVTARNEGDTVYLAFTLSAGEYATTVCREFMKADPLQMI